MGATAPCPSCHTATESVPSHTSSPGCGDSCPHEGHRLPAGHLDGVRRRGRGPSTPRQVGGECSAPPGPFQNTPLVLCEVSVPERSFLAPVEAAEAGEYWGDERAPREPGGGTCGLVSCSFLTTPDSEPSKCCVLRACGTCQLSQLQKGARLSFQPGTTTGEVR